MRNVEKIKPFGQSVVSKIIFSRHLLHLFPVLVKLTHIWLYIYLCISVHLQVSTDSLHIMQFTKKNIYTLVSLVQALSMKQSIVLVLCLSLVQARNVGIFLLLRSPWRNLVSECCSLTYHLPLSFLCLQVFSLKPLLIEGFLAKLLATLWIWTS